MVLKTPATHKHIFVTTLKTARIGVRESQYEVGLMYAHGMGVAQDLEQAVVWIQKAAERGLAAAQYLLATRYAVGSGVQQDEKQALWWLLQAAQQGHVKALFKLGTTCAAPHPALARACYLDAAELGLAQAQFALGKEFASSEGQVPDYAAALQWYQKAAEQGFAPAKCTRVAWA